MRLFQECSGRLSLLEFGGPIVWKPVLRSLAFIGWLALLLSVLIACEHSRPVPQEADGPAFVTTPLPPIESPCPNQRGMVGVPFPDGSCYLMDAWPATRGEYFDALAERPMQSRHFACIDNPASSGPREDTRGGQNDTNLLGAYCLVTEAYDDIAQETVRVDNRMPWPPSAAERDEPMSCISWCDAHAYCDRVGKRLCNQRTLTDADLYESRTLEDPDNDEYYNACTAGGTRASPNGMPWPLAPPTEPEHRGTTLRYSVGHGHTRARLREVGEGPYRGLWGLSVGLEVTGPVHSSLRPNGYPGQDRNIPMVTACGARLLVAQPAHLDPETADRFWDGKLVRCCADLEE